MGSSQVRSQTANETSRAQTVDMKLEVVVIPVSNVDRAKDFYRSLGWRPDADFAGDDNFRVIQFTPPGSGCSVIFGKNITAAAPGSIMFASNVMRRCALRGPAEARHFFERAGEPTFASAV